MNGATCWDFRGKVRKSKPVRSRFAGTLGTLTTWFARKALGGSEAFFLVFPELDTSRLVAVRPPTTVRPVSLGETNSAATSLRIPCDLSDWLDTRDFAAMDPDAGSTSEVGRGGRVGSMDWSVV